jgi:hypothetical protein
VRPNPPSLTRAELSELLEVPVEFVDALLESGRVLCQLKGGEVRIPRAQVEQFLRESLRRLYLNEAAELGREEARAAEPVEAAPPEPEPEPLRDAEPEREPEPGPEPVAEAEPVPEVEAAAEPHPVQHHGRRHVTPVAMAMRADEDREQRIATRFIPLRQIGGIFGDTKFVIMQISATGLRIRHNEPLLPGEEAKLSFALLRPARSVVVRAKVVWTSLARSGTERFSISGIRFTEHQDRVEAAIESLRAANELQPERRAASRRTTDTMSVLGGISDEEMALVTNAFVKFANDPVEASRWYSRARFALSDESVRRAAPERPRDREEVLGIWEYLDRQVDIGKIAGVVTWMKSGSAGPPS